MLFGQIPTFDQKLATMRKYEISCSIILQALSQLKDIYKDKWNTIVSNCDTKLFLGCDDSETIEWMLKMLGKKTTIVENVSYQAAGSGGSTSYNRSSLELLTIDQITMMQDDECLVRIRGVRPYYGKKFELTEHKNYPYAHKTSGSFEIPVSKDIESRQSGPLRLRRVSEAKSEQQKKVNRKKTSSLNPVPNQNKSFVSAPAKHTPPAQNNKTSVQNKVTKGADNKKPLPNVIKNVFKNKNKAKKTEAEETKELLKLFDTEKEVLSTEQMLLDSLGMSQDTVVENIKETIETTIILESVPDTVVFAMTN